MTLKHRFVSLGGDCRPAHHIRRLSGNATSLFFDWLVTPIQAVMPLIETGFSDAFDRGFLEWHDHGHEFRAVDQRHRLQSWHQFKSLDDAHVNQTIAMMRRSGRAFLDLLDDPEPIVFVRRWNVLDGAARLDGAQELLADLRRIKPNSALLYLTPHEGVRAGIDGNLIVSEIEHVVHDPWWGDDAFYDLAILSADSAADAIFSCELSTGTPRHS